MPRLVTDEMISLALSRLGELVAEAPAARARRIRAEYGVKRTFSRLFLDATGNNAEREAKARSRDDYDKALADEIDAIEADERCRDDKNKCIAILDAWRSESANVRAMETVR